MTLDEKVLIQLLTDPHEDLDREYKIWLDLSNDADRAVVAKSLLGLANHGGGFLVFGFHDEQPPRAEATTAIDLASYTTDVVGDIVKRYADPTFQCQLRMIDHPGLGVRFPIVIVPGGHTVPIRCKSDDPTGKGRMIDKYFIRRPGPQTEPPQTGKEWTDLIQRCVFNQKEQLLAGIRGMLLGLSPKSEEHKEPLEQWRIECDEKFATLVREDLKEEQPSRFQYGYWTVAACINDGEVKYSLKALLNAMKNADRPFYRSAWNVPTRSGIAPYNDGASEIACWTAEGPGGRSADLTDYWRARTDLMFFLRRGHMEDAIQRYQIEPGTVLLADSPVCIMTDSLSFLVRVCKELNLQGAQISLLSEWSRTRNRKLITNPSELFPLLPSLYAENFQTRREDISVEFTTNQDDVESNLPELLFDPVQEFFNAFNYFPSETELRRYLSKKAVFVP